MIKRAPRHRIPPEIVSQILILYDGKIRLKTISLKTGVPVNSIRTIAQRYGRSRERIVDPALKLRIKEKSRETLFLKAQERINRGIQIALTQRGGMDAKTRR